MTESPFLHLLKNRIDLHAIPFTDRGSRLMVLRVGDTLAVRLAERWYKRAGQLSAYRRRPPLIDEWRFTDGDGQPLSFELTTYPHRVDCTTDVVVFTLAFVDTETILVVIPHGACGLSFLAYLDQCH